MPYQRSASYSGSPRKKTAAGHSVFPADAIATPLRRTSNDPQLRRQVEQFMVRTLAPEGSKGMDHEQLYHKVDNYMLEKNSRNNINMFTAIRESGPFELAGSHVVYVPHRDYEWTRRSKYETNQTTYQPSSTPSYHDPSLNSPISESVARTNKSSPYPAQTGQDHSPKPRRLLFYDDDTGHNEAVAPVNRRTQDLYDSLAYTIARAGARDYPMRRLISEVWSQGDYTKGEVAEALRRGPFHVSTEINVAYVPHLDKHSATRPGTFASLAKSVSKPSRRRV